VAVTADKGKGKVDPVL